MGYFKNLDIEIRELDFRGVSVQEIANRVGLTVQVVLETLNDSIDDEEFDCVEIQGTVQ
jgi:predicted transcriptional regulator